VPVVEVSAKYILTFHEKFPGYLIYRCLLVEYILMILFDEREYLENVSNIQNNQESEAKDTIVFRNFQRKKFAF